jgi:hypothetical protein
VTLGGYTFVANVQIVTPLPEEVLHLLTQDAIERHNNMVGTWDVSAIHVFSLDDPYRSYYAIASEITGERSIKPILVGGLPGFRLPVAIYPDNVGNIGTIVPTYPSLVDWNALRLDVMDDTQDSVSFVLDYQDIRERALAIPPIEAGLSGGGGGLGSQTSERASGRILLMPILAIVLCIICIKALLPKIRSSNS